MAKIILNNNKEIKGYLTAMRKMDTDGNITVSGQLLTHRYIEDIKRISTERYDLTGVLVHSEEFASNDAMIRYEFFADTINIIGGESNLPEEVIKQIEEDYFKEENAELIHEEVYKEWISKAK